MTTRIATIAGIALVAIIGAGVAARRYSCCGFADSTTACEAPARSIATAGAPTGDYDRLQSVGCRLSCARQDVPEGTAIASQPGVALGEVTRCPVSGVVFAVTADGAQETVQGRTYRACCHACIEKLRAEPARYLRL